MGQQQQQQQKPSSAVESPPTPPPQASSPPSVPPAGFSGEESAAWRKYPNPPDAFNPDPVTLRDQWRFAIRQYSRWYSHAWGTAIFAGLGFFALGWFIKGSNPLPSRVFGSGGDEPPPPDPSADRTDR